MPNKTTIGIIASVIALVVVLCLPNTGVTPTPPAPSRPPTVEIFSDAVKVPCRPPLGNPNAAWTIVEFGDFQCPSCGRCRPYVERLIARSGGKAKLYFVNYPLSNDHMFAMPAALAAIAASDQGKFWAMYDQLYMHQNDLRMPGIFACARESGVDMKEFKADMFSRASYDLLGAQVKAGNLVPVISTPTFLVHQDGAKDVRTYAGMSPSATDNRPGLRQLMLSCPWGATFKPNELPPR